MQEINYALCHPAHCGYVEDKPKEEDYNAFIGQSYDNYAYNKAEFESSLSEWNAKYGPEPEARWIKFEDREPENGQVIYFAGLDTSAKIKRQFVSNENYNITGLPLLIKGHDKYSKNAQWADAEDLDTRREYWQYHQERYKDWGKHGVEIDFFLEKNYMWIECDNFSYSGPILETVGFESILRVSGKEL